MKLETAKLLKSPNVYAARDNEAAEKEKSRIISVARGPNSC
jgi:hypothetical protein